MLVIFTFVCHWAHYVDLADVSRPLTKDLALTCRSTYAMQHRRCRMMSIKFRHAVHRELMIAAHHHLGRMVVACAGRHGTKVCVIGVSSESNTSATADTFMYIVSIVAIVYVASSTTTALSVTLLGVSKRRSVDPLGMHCATCSTCISARKCARYCDRI